MRRFGTVFACLAFATGCLAQVNPTLLAGLQWRNLGAFRAGRAGAVCGVAGHRGTYYFGAAQGGFWKSVSAGSNWVNITDASAPDVAGISACAVAPSDPEEIFFSSNARGPGLYRTTDGGASWTHIGPVTSSILVDPHDAKLLIASRAGADGGVFRSSDGGQTWRRTGPTSAAGAVGQLQWDANNPAIIYVSRGGAGGRGGGRGAPAEPVGGPTFFKSTDEGQTWQPIVPSGLPGPLGNFAVAGNSHSQRLYTTEVSRSTLYRSDDGGATWTAGASPLNTANGLVYCDPQNADVVYVLGTAVYRSTDGGKTLAPFKGSPGGDDPREWWIDYSDGHNILYGGDQGASVSMDGGYTWSPWYNQPTAQMYHLTVDNRFPYWVYGSQQDSGIVATRDRGDFGQINPWDWIPFPGWEGSTMAVDPLNPNLMYANGNYGDLARMWMDTWDSQIVNPAVGHDVMHRNSNSPILFSPLDPHALYFVTQYVMVSHDGAQTFTKASPDLTVRPGAAAPAAGAFARNGASITAFTVSSAKPGVMWAGAPGLIWTTSDDGKTWQNVTPSDWPANSGVTNLEASHFDPLEAYAVVTHGGAGGGGFGNVGGADPPYLYRTRDGGKSWQPIVNGLPADQPTGSHVNVVREDPKTRGLLFAGTETEVHVSFDDGDHWQSLRLNSPNTSYRDLVVHGDDLVTATYGRSFWVLDDIAPLRVLAKQAQQVQSQAAYLFAPSPAVRLQRDNNYDTPLPPEVPHGLNPPEGAILYYWLSQDVSGPVTIEVRDAQHRLVRTLSDNPPPNPPDPLGAAPEPWKRAPEPLATTAGMHRVNWDLRWSRPEAMSFNYDQVMGAIYHDTPPTPQGPMVTPGAYTITLSAGGHTATGTLTITQDPREDPKVVTLDGMNRQLALSLKLMQGLDASKHGFDQVQAVRDQIKALGSGNLPADVAAAASKLDAAMAQAQGTAESAVSGPYGVAAGGLPTFATANGHMAGLLVIVDYNSDMPPVAAQEQAWRDYCADYTVALNQWKSVLTTQAPAFKPALKLPTALPPALSCQ